MKFFFDTANHRDISDIWDKMKPLCNRACVAGITTNPKAMAKNIYVSSSGSLIAVLKRIMDKAPTNPSESARDDFTIVITNTIVGISVSITNVYCDRSPIRRE